MTRATRRERLAHWGAPAVLLIGIVVLAAILVRSPPDRGAFALGLVFPVQRYDQFPALIGLGLALAQAPRRWLVFSSVVFAAAIPFGGVVASRIAMALAGGLNIIPYVLLIAPAGCVSAGLALALPGALRIRVLPLAALISGVVLGMLVNLDDPMPAEWMFAGGAILCGVWLVAVALLLWWRFEQAWFPIAGRILGGWLIAIGAMLAALAFIPSV